MLSTEFMGESLIEKDLAVSMSQSLPRVTDSRGNLTGFSPH